MVTLNMYLKKIILLCSSLVLSFNLFSQTSSLQSIFHEYEAAITVTDFYQCKPFMSKRPGTTIVFSTSGKNLIINYTFYHCNINEKLHDVTEIIRVTVDMSEVKLEPNYLCLRSEAGIKVEMTINGEKQVFLSDLWLARGSTKPLERLLHDEMEKVLAPYQQSTITTITPVPNQKPSSPQVTSPSFKNNYSGSRYSISYPDNWSTLETVQGADVYIGANDGSIAFTILSFPTYYSLDEVLNEGKSQGASAGWKSSVTSTNIDGVKCYKETITYVYQGMSVKQISYLLKKNGYIYNIRFGNDATQVNNNLTRIEQIAKTFHVKY